MSPSLAGDFFTTVPPGKQALVRGPKLGLENVPPRSRLFWEPLQSPLFSVPHGCIFKDAFPFPLALFWFDVGFGGIYPNCNLRSLLSQLSSHRKFGNLNF